MHSNKQVQNPKKTSNVSPKQRSTHLHPLTRATHPASIIQQARASPDLLTSADVLQLQRTIGNEAVGRLLNEIGQNPKSQIQAKLTVNPPGDRYEQEADRVARKVVSQINQQESQPSSQQQLVQRQELPEEEELIQTKMTEVIQRKEIPEEELQMKSEVSIIQRQEIPEEELQMKLEVPIIQRQEIPEEELQMKPEVPIIQRQEIPEEELQMMPMVQRKQGGGMAAMPELEAAIHRSRGGGHTLDGTVQKHMSTGMGYDFSKVRVHTGSEADALNKQLSAKAFTTGRDIFFRRGAYDPGSIGGKELIAHELSHVVQQGTGRVSGEGARIQRTPYWWYSSNLLVFPPRGPLDTAQLKQRAREGGLKPHYSIGQSDALDVKPEEDRYRPARDVPELSELFKSGPKLGKGSKVLQGAAKGQQGLSLTDVLARGGATAVAGLSAGGSATEAASVAGAVGAPLEAVGGGIEFLTGVQEMTSESKGKGGKLEGALGAMTGAGRAVKGGATAAILLPQVGEMVAAGKTITKVLAEAGGSTAGKVLAPAAIALGGAQMLSGGYGAYKAHKSAKALEGIKTGTEKEQVRESAAAAQEAQKSKRTQSLITAGKGAVTVAGGAVLMAAGISNPVGWGILAAAGLIAGAAFIIKRVWQRQQGKKLVEQKMEEHRLALEAWEASPDPKGPKPVLDPRYDPDRITWRSWRTYGDVYREEVEEQRKVVADRLYETGVKGNPYIDEMRQIVEAMGFKINSEAGKPSKDQIYKELKKGDTASVVQGGGG